MDVRVEIDRDSGDYRTFRRWLIVADEDYTYPDVEKPSKNSGRNSGYHHPNRRILRRTAA